MWVHLFSNFEFFKLLNFARWQQLLTMEEFVAIKNREEELIYTNKLTSTKHQVSIHPIKKNSNYKMHG
jgi:hypothetical protein